MGSPFGAWITAVMEADARPALMQVYARLASEAHPDDDRVVDLQRLVDAGDDPSSLLATAPGLDDVDDESTFVRIDADAPRGGCTKPAAMLSVRAQAALRTWLRCASAVGARRRRRR